MSVPAALVGAWWSAKFVSANPTILRSAYSLLMIGLAIYLLSSPRPDQLEQLAIEEGECQVPLGFPIETGEVSLATRPIGETGEAQDATAVTALLPTTTTKETFTVTEPLAQQPSSPLLRTTVAADGSEFTYLSPASSSLGQGSTAAITAGGGVLTGLLGVGVGEVILPQLVRGCCMPLPVAAGSSVAIVVVTALTAAVVQFASLATAVMAASNEGISLLDGLIQVVPWSLVQFTIPGVLVGGQLAPFLASQGAFSDETIERFVAALFGFVGLAFAAKALQGASS